MTAPAGVFDPQTTAIGAPPMIDEEITRIQQDAVAQSMGQEPTPEQSQVQEIVVPNPPTYLESLPRDEQARLLAAALYGADFPALNESDEESDWVSWVRGRWSAHRSAVEKHLHLIERNRLYRAGQQWISSKGRGPWRESLKAVDSARVVYNMIDKALDHRLQVATDQRPGFHVEPVTQDPDDKRKAEAQQLALEYQHDQQQMDEVMKVAAYWAQTDGVAFLETYWDADAGPEDEGMGENGEKKPLGDLRTRVRRVEQVRVSANATRTEAPYYQIVRDVIPATEAAATYGLAGVQPGAQTLSATQNGDTSPGINQWVLDQTNVGEGDRLRDQNTVERFIIYVDRHPDILPEGLQMIVVGDSVVWGPGPLLFKRKAVVPVRDGSTDPSYYPRPIMEGWLDHQVRVNAYVSALVDSVRVNKGGRFVSRPGAIQRETFIGGGTSVMEVNGAIGSLDDVVKAVQGFSVGEDVKFGLELEIKAFENASGWNDTSRGQIANDASGRAILASREQLERVFSPPVSAIAQAYTEWGKVNIAGMAFGYDVPRNLGTVGKGRPDLARALTAQDFDGISDVKVKAETLMPMPRAYRQFRLDDLLAKQLITPQQYLRRIEWAFTNNLNTPDEQQEARARRIAEAIRLRQPVPEMRWQDNEAIHQDVLEREIILQDDLEPDIIKAAQQRWADLANQSAQKMGGMMPPMAGAPAAPGGAEPPQLPSGTQPLAAANPSVGAAPPMVAPTDQGAAAAEFESLSPQ